LLLLLLLVGGLWGVLSGEDEGEGLREAGLLDAFEGHLFVCVCVCL
jgi:hypothetical protein